MINAIKLLLYSLEIIAISFEYKISFDYGMDS